MRQYHACVQKGLGKWFASRQPQNFPEQWLAGHADCPTCRFRFTVRDIQLLAGSTDAANVGVNGVL